MTVQDITNGFARCDAHTSAEGKSLSLNMGDKNLILTAIHSTQMYGTRSELE
jgi:hypothetical protein